MSEMHFNKADENSYRNKIIQKLQEDGLPVAIFGTGKFAKSVAERLFREGIAPIFFIDEEEYYSDGKKIELRGNYIPCLKYTEAMSYDKKFNILNGNIDFGKNVLLKKDFASCHIIDYLDVYPAHCVGYTFLMENIGILKEIYNSLKDEQSKCVLKAFFESRYTGDIQNLCALHNDIDCLYDWELLELSANDIIIDAGAYTGDTIIEMRDYIGQLPRQIYAFEPDENNCERLRKNFSCKDLESIEIITKGLYYKTDTCYFASSGTLGSKIVENSDCSIEVIAIDDSIQYKNTSVIKMDIEGSELNALRGAKNLIEKNHPRLAICIYHNNKDIIEIYSYLKVYGYSFYLRQHSNSVEETVLYAI